MTPPCTFDIGCVLMSVLFSWDIIILINMTGSVEKPQGNYMRDVSEYSITKTTCGETMERVLWRYVLYNPNIILSIGLMILYIFVPEHTIPFNAHSLL